MAIDFLTYSPVNLLITLPAFGSAVVVSVTVVCSGVVVGVFVYFVMITECGNEKVARSVIHRRKSVISCVITEYGNKKVACSVIRSRKVVILCVITEYGNKNIVCFVIHRIKLVILEDITDSGE